MPLEQFTYPVIFSGVTLVVYSLAYLSRYQKAVGPLRVCKVGLIGGIPCAVMVPCASLVGGNLIAQQVSVPTSSLALASRAQLELESLYVAWPEACGGFRTSEQP